MKAPGCKVWEWQQIPVILEYHKLNQENWFKFKATLNSLVSSKLFWDTLWALSQKLIDS